MVSFGSFITSEPKEYYVDVYLARPPTPAFAAAELCFSVFQQPQQREGGRASCARGGAHVEKRRLVGDAPRSRLPRRGSSPRCGTPCVSRYLSADFRCSSWFPRWEPSARKILLSDIFRSLYRFRHFYHVFVFAHVVNPYYVGAPCRQQSAVTASVPYSRSSGASRPRRRAYAALARRAYEQADSRAP